MVKKTVIFLTISIAAFIFLAWYFSNIFTYFVISAVLATILRPLTDYINKAHIYQVKIPRVLAIFMSFSVMLFVISLFVIVFIPLISEQVEIFAGLNYDSLINKATQPLTDLEHFMIQNDLTNESVGFIKDNVKKGLVSLITEIQVTEMFANVLSITGSLFIGIIAVVFITFFLLYQEGIIKRHIINLIPNQYFEVSIAALYKIEKLLTNYLLGLIIQMISIFTIAFAGLSIMGIKYSATIALFAAVTNIIPYLGPILGSLFGIFVGISTNPELISDHAYIFLIAKLIGVFVVVQLTDNLVLQPLIFSKSIKAHPLEIFLIIFAGATLAGIPGMIAAIPVYTIIRVSFVEIYKGYKSYYIFKS